MSIKGAVIAREKINPEHTLTKKRCDLCESVEGEKRAVGGYTVILEQINFSGRSKLACQSCARKQEVFHNFEIRMRDKKKNLFWNKITRSLYLLF